MRRLFLVGFMIAGFALATGALYVPDGTASPATVNSPIAKPDETTSTLVVHEWGTFTSFSGSDGNLVRFEPNNDDLPPFVYRQEGDGQSKRGRLSADGTISMETPVLYFYTGREMNVSVRVDFPLGWITEWYPFAAQAPMVNEQKPRAPGQTIRWNVKLQPGAPESFPTEKSGRSYYQARNTAAAPIQTEAKVADLSWLLRGGVVLQHEKFLFYRGVGAFPTPVAVTALGKGKVQIKNTTARSLDGLMLISVHDGKVAFKALNNLSAGSEINASLTELDGNKAQIAEVMIKELTAAGLYDKEAQAMVKTWDSAWFSEEGDRLLYLVPRGRTDELLPLKVEPKPTEVVRVMVGRHDFLTPEQEAQTEQNIKRLQALQAQVEAAEKDIAKIGRFADQARLLATKRLHPETKP